MAVVRQRLGRELVEHDEEDVGALGHGWGSRWWDNNLRL
jgi:hypothetical protein